MCPLNFPGCYRFPDTGREADLKQVTAASCRENGDFWRISCVDMSDGVLNVSPEPVSFTPLISLIPVHFSIHVSAVVFLSCR